MKKEKYIIISSLIVCVMLYYIEQILKVSYTIKTLAKIMLFITIPYFYIKIYKNESVKKSINYPQVKINQLKNGIALGIISFIIVLFSYRIFGRNIDFSSIARELNDKSKINHGNFIFVAIYITIVNSFLEEFFFRGFIFLNLYKLNNKKIAYVYSAFLFAIYHISIFKTWFDMWIIILALLGLLIIAFVFNWLDTKSDNFFNSWIVHIFADVSIILIGFRILNML